MNSKQPSFSVQTQKHQGPILQTEISYISKEISTWISKYVYIKLFKDVITHIHNHAEYFILIIPL